MRAFAAVCCAVGGALCAVCCNAHGCGSGVSVLVACKGCSTDVAGGGSCRWGSGGAGLPRKCLFCAGDRGEVAGWYCVLRVVS